MIGRRATVGLALLCALLFSAIAVQSAFAAKATETTAFTCVKEGGEEDFKDGHCDEKVSPGTGEYGHVAIEANKTTAVELNNTTTGGATEPAILKGEPFKVKTEITCKKVSGEGWMENVSDPEEPETHTGRGEATSIFTECSVQKPAKCSAKEPIETISVGEALEELGPEKNEMGGEVKPSKGTTFTTITFEGSECALNGKPFKVEGSAVATGGTANQTSQHSGSTAVYTNAMTKETLKAAEKPAEFSLKTTVRMAGGNPIAATTTKAPKEGC